MSELMTVFVILIVVAVTAGLVVVLVLTVRENRRSKIIDERMISSVQNSTEVLETIDTGLEALTANIRSQQPKPPMSEQ